MNVKIQEIISTFSMEILVEGDYEIEITENELNRSGLQLAGFYGYFVQQRIQILGNAEISYLNSLSKKKLQESVNNLMEHNIPCIIVTQNNPIPDAIITYGRKYNRWVLSTPLRTSDLHVDLTSYLQNLLAESICYHGDLLDISGVGVLLTGKSGIGKSETALELIRRGHLLIADDNVLIKNPSPNILVGMGSELTKNLIEIRGIGILDIKSIFGLRSIRTQKNIEIVVQLENWDEAVYYDRLGDKYEYTKIMEVDLPITRVPVLPGRNLAIIVEVIALNYRQNSLGYNAAKELDQNIKNLKK